MDDPGCFDFLVVISRAIHCPLPFFSTRALRACGSISYERCRQKGYELSWFSFGIALLVGGVAAPAVREPCLSLGSPAAPLGPLPENENFYPTSSQ